MENIIVELASDHRQVEDLFSLIENNEGLENQEKKTHFTRLYTALRIHILAVEAVVYGPLLTSKVGKSQALEGYEEHRLALLLLDELARVPMDSELWSPKLKVLRENVKNHVKVEEDLIFKTLKSEFSPDALIQMSEEFHDRKEGILAELRKIA